MVLHLKRWAVLFLVLVAVGGIEVRAGEQAAGEPGLVAVSGGRGGGNPFHAPAEAVYSIYDYRHLANVSETLSEFLDLNEGLPGSVKPATVSPEDAVRHLKALFAGPENQAFLRSVGEAPQYNTAEALQGAALVLIARQRGAEALACLLQATEKAPRSAAAWLNLAACALHYRRANEALALIARAEALGPLPNGAWDLSGGRLADYLRAYAWMLRGEYERAHAVLVKVVEAEPNLKEAALTLALVEARLGKNPRRSFLLGVWRQRGRLIVRDEPPERVNDPAKIAGRDGLVEGEDLTPAMPDLFDVTQGTPGQLPTVKIPATAEDLAGTASTAGEGMLEAMAAASAQNQAWGAAYRVFEASKTTPLYQRRMVALYNRATVRYGVAREIDLAARTTDTLGEKLRLETENAIERVRLTNEPISKRQFEESNRPGFVMTDAVLRAHARELNAVTEAELGLLGPLLVRYHTAIRQEYQLRSSYMHGMLAHIGAPALRTALVAAAEEVRQNSIHELHASVLNLANLLGAPIPADQVKAGAGDKGHGPACNDDNAKWSASVDLEIFEVELTCNSVSCEISTPLAPPLTSGSLELGFDTSGTMTIFAGPKASIAGVGSVKGGLYLTADKDGFRDFGGKVEGKVSGAIGPVSTSRKVVDSAISFVPGPVPIESPAQLPSFD